jgi:hypothetical protein
MWILPADAQLGADRAARSVNIGLSLSIKRASIDTARHRTKLPVCREKF